MESAAKKVKTSPLLIGTHNGTFHADEALAVYLLRLHPNYKISSLLRTRDPSALATCHTVVDVGGEYDPSRNLYDHHQRNFTQTFPSRPTKLSSAGLVYLHFGKPIIAQHTQLSEQSEEVGLLWRKMYTEFVEALDAHDNGISVYDPADVKDIPKRFDNGGINLGSLVGDMNGEWDDPLSKEGDSTPTIQEKEDQRFEKASKFMGETFMRKLNRYFHGWLPARKDVRDAYFSRKDHDRQGRLMVFQEGLPWKDHLYTLEAEHPANEKVIYALYPESTVPGSKWRIQAVPETEDSFQSRKALPEKWRGVRDQELDEVTGIGGCVFVHASGFIGGNKTFEGAMEMARKGLDL